MTHKRTKVDKQRKRNMRRNQVQRELEQAFKAERAAEPQAESK
jgi:hypothetical protein